MNSGCLAMRIGHGNRQLCSTHRVTRMLQIEYSERAKTAQRVPMRRVLSGDTFKRIPLVSLAIRFLQILPQDVLFERVEQILSCPHPPYGNTHTPKSERSDRTLNMAACSRTS